MSLLLKQSIESGACLLMQYLPEQERKAFKSPCILFRRYVPFGLKQTCLAVTYDLVKTLCTSIPVFLA